MRAIRARSAGSSSRRRSSSGPRTSCSRTRRCGPGGTGLRTARPGACTSSCRDGGDAPRASGGSRRRGRRRGAGADRARTRPRRSPPRRCGVGAAHDLLRCERVAALAVVRDPVVDHLDVDLGVALDLPRLDQHLGDVGRARSRRRSCGTTRSRIAAGMRGLGGADDHAVLVDPHAVGHVDEAEQLVAHVGFVDQRRVLGVRLLDERAASLARRRGRRSRSRLLRVPAVAEGLPQRQVEAASSPRRPGDQHDLLAAETRELEGVAVGVGELEVGRDGGGEHAAGDRSLGAEGPEPALSSATSGMPSRSATTRTSTRPSARRTSGGSGTQTSPLHAPSGLIAQPGALCEYVLVDSQLVEDQRSHLRRRRGTSPCASTDTRSRCPRGGPIWALFQDYDRWTDYAPMVQRVDVLYPGRRRPQRPATARHLQDAVRSGGLGARARHRRRARRLHVHDDLGTPGNDQIGHVQLNRSPRTGRGSASTRRYNLQKAPFKWFEGPIYKFINKNNEDSMRRASAWLTAHPELPRRPGREVRRGLGLVEAVTMQPSLGARPTESSRTSDRQRQNERSRE